MFIALNKKLRYYGTEGLHDALLINSCYVSRGMGARKVSNCKSDLQAHWQWCHSIGHTQFPIRLPL